MDLLRGLGQQLLGLWRQMSLARRGLVVALAVVSLAGIAALAVGLLRAEYVPLLSNVAPEEVSAVTARLGARGIPYRLEGGGTTVAVPTDRLAAARVELAGSGLPLAGGKGFEVFDDAPLGMTPFVQNVNFTRALQAELARSIAQLEPVAQARVHIVRPDSTPFLREQKPTTASVVLKLRTKARLNRSSAEAIIALVSRAVEGLAPENVTLIDTAGHLLSEPASAEERVSSGQLEFRRHLEAYLASKAEDILRRHLGIHRAVVRVAAEVDFQRVKEKSETVSPEGKVVIAERLVTTKSTSPSGPRGIAGAASNVVRAAATSAGGPAGGGQSETTQTDYAVSRTSREMENQHNGVNRLTVAALVDLSGEEEGKKLSLSDARELIKQAIGFKEGRDDIKVTDVGLAGAPPPPAEEDKLQSARLESILSIVRTGALVVGLFLIASIVILVRNRRSQRAVLPSPVVGPESFSEVEEFRRIAESDPERVARILTLLLGSSP